MAAAPWQTVFKISLFSSCAPGAVPSVGGRSVNVQVPGAVCPVVMEFPPGAKAHVYPERVARWRGRCLFCSREARAEPRKAQEIGWAGPAHPPFSSGETEAQGEGRRTA